MTIRLLLGRLGEVADFVNLQQKLARIPGFLADLEGFALYLLAAEGPGVGAIVEIGSYLGRSTAFLGAGTRSGAREKVTAVDHFRGSPEHHAGQGWQSEVLLREGSTYGRFLENLQAAGLADQVETLIASSAEACQSWNRPIRLLFIDGDHSFESSRQDFELWSRFVVSHGIICFHDINQWPGVTKFYQELMASTQAYQELATVCSLKIIQRR